MITNSEYIFSNLEEEETNKFIKNTLLEHDQRFGYNYNKKVNVKCNAKFFDRTKNETKKITFECCNVLRAIYKIMQSSAGSIKLT